MSAINILASKLRRYSTALLAVLAVLVPSSVFGQDAADYSNIDATEIVREADRKLRGSSSYGETTITIVRPSYTREMSMVSWSMGNEYSLILITEPARDEGTAFLKRGNEIWNWLPTIERTVKLPPSMMSQNWMGTDFTNDDLVRESSIVTDYSHTVVGREELLGLQCWILDMIPKPDAAVVWGRVRVWIEEKDFMQMRVEFYDEDDFLISTMESSDPQMFDGKRLPSRMVMIPQDEEGHRTEMETRELQFDFPIEESFFTVRNMRSARPRN